MTDSLFEIVCNFFVAENWSFTQVSDQTLLRLQFEGDNGLWACIARTRDEHGQFVFHSVCPLIVPEDRRLAVAEFITRANYGLILGNFEMDFDDGEIHFKTSTDCSGGTVLGTPLLRQLVFTNVLVMDRFFPALAKVIYGGFSPLDALAFVNIS